LAPLVRPGHAEGQAADTVVLEFSGFRAGAPVGEVAALIRLRGGQFRCQRAKVDPRVSECRGTLDDLSVGGPVEIWLSAIDSISGVITISGQLESTQFARWKTSIERRYGPAGARVEGSQWMMQWVHRQRMLRLTWRVERGKRSASVSLIDGRVLDSWGRDRSRARQPGQS